MSTVREFDFSVDLLVNILWQYDGTTGLRGIVTQKNDWYAVNQTEFWDDWITDVFNLQTANDFGLSVWAFILNVPLVVIPEPDPDKIAWGFGANHKNFGNGNFASDGGSFGLTTEQKRLVLQLRYFQLVTRGAAPEVNAFLNQVFAPFGITVYAADGLNMTARYVFSADPPSALKLVFDNYDLLPRPAAVAVDYTVVGSKQTWGFGVYHFNYENGNFYVPPVIVELMNQDDALLTDQDQNFLVGEI